MNRYPDFRTRLGLEEGADERQVKRAYARELKKIDQERDLDGFQQLRACYEAALEWAARRAAAAAPDPVPAAPASETTSESASGSASEPAGAPGGTPVPDFRPRQTPAMPRLETVAPSLASAAAAVPPQPHALASAVFADFAAGTAKLAAVPEAKSADEGARLAPWMAGLRAALADPRLMHLDARSLFEQRIAMLLADGWRPGHHLLLSAAAGVFGWGDDRHALARLGHHGRVLDAALDQRAMFQAQNIKLRTAQRDALALLRAAELPGERTMRRHIRAVRTLASHFPDLLRIVAPGATVMTWLERCPPTERERRQDAAAGQDQGRWWKPKSWSSTAFLIFILLRVAMYFASHETPRPPPPASQELFDQIDARRLGKPPAGVPPDWSSYPNADAVLRNQHGQGGRGGPKGGRAPTEAQLAAIRARIDYHPGPGAAPGQQRTNLLVTLDDQGSVSNIDVLSAPSDPAFTAAVQLAIRRSAPFPPETTRMFSAVFSDEAPQARRTSQALPAPPAPAEQRGKAVPMARMAMIRARIDYRPGADVAPGEQRVELAVRLDDKGNIAHMKRLLVRGDPAWADAVEAAIRGIGPFAPETARAFKLQFWVTVGQHPQKPPPASPAPD